MKDHEQILKVFKSEWIKAKDVMIEGYLRTALESWMTTAGIERCVPNPVSVRAGELEFRGTLEFQIERRGPWGDSLQLVMRFEPHNVEVVGR